MRIDPADIQIVTLDGVIQGNDPDNWIYATGDGAAMGDQLYGWWYGDNTGDGRTHVGQQTGRYDSGGYNAGDAMFSDLPLYNV